ncbi:MAG: transcription antitermination factor NusB [Eubacteriales bacterium]|nr:transcription antitermination factor NusB [Eubacteriales bacterium]MDY3333216.1 transcription antitermination factor NusB [Gallibacter sp.]
MNRQEARELLMQIVYQMDLQEDKTLELVERSIEDKSVTEKNEQYIIGGFKQLVQHQDEIDNLIQDNAKNWRLERIAKVDLAILRLAVCEILYMDEIPAPVAINEAVEIAKKYSQKDSPKFINGVLGSIGRKLL